MVLLVLLALLIIAASAIFTLHWRRINDPFFKNYKGPGPIPGLGSTYELKSKNLNDDFMRLFGQYGNIFRFYFPLGLRSVMIKEPELIQKIIHDDVNFQRDEFWSIHRENFGPRIVFATDGKIWKEKRGALNHNFRATSINKLIPHIVERSLAAAKVLESHVGRSYDVDKLSSKLTLDIIMRLVTSDSGRFIENPKSLPIQEFFDNAAKEAMALRTTFHVLKYIPSLSRARYLITQRAALDYVHKMVQERVKGNIKLDDIMSDLIDQGFDSREIANECLGLLWAGHDTTSHTLSFALYNIAKSPEIASKVQAEVDLLCPDVEKIDGVAVSKLKYLNAVIKETLRLYPQAIFHPATVMNDAEIDGHHFPKGSVAFLYTYAVQRDERHWTEPLKYDPERFIVNDIAIEDGVAAADTPKVDAQKKTAPVYFPFLQGRHTCIGQHLAVLEMRVVLAILVRKFCFEVEPGFELNIVPTLTLPSLNGVRLIPRLR